jgi:hypothetical protein
LAQAGVSLCWHEATGSTGSALRRMLALGHRNTPLLAGVRRLAKGTELTGLFGGAPAGSSDCSGPGLAGCASDVCIKGQSYESGDVRHTQGRASGWWLVATIAGLIITGKIGTTSLGAPTGACEKSAQSSIFPKPPLLRGERNRSTATSATCCSAGLGSPA